MGEGEKIIVTYDAFRTDQTAKRRCYWWHSMPLNDIVVAHYLSSFEGDWRPEEASEITPTNTLNDADNDVDWMGDTPTGPRYVAADHEMAQGASPVIPTSSQLDAAYVLGRVRQGATREAMQQLNQQQPSGLLDLAQRAGADDLSEQLERVNIAQGAAADGEHSVMGGPPGQSQAPLTPSVCRVPPTAAQQAATDGTGPLASPSEGSRKRKSTEVTVDTLQAFLQDHHQLEAENKEYKNLVATLESQLKAAQAAAAQQVAEALAAADAQHAEAMTDLLQQAEVEHATAQAAQAAAQAEIAALKRAREEDAAEAAAAAENQKEENDQKMAQMKQDLADFMARHFENGPGP